MGKPSAPEPTNPLPTLALQQAYNTPNQFTPMGNVLYTPPSLPSNVTPNNFGDMPLSQIGQSSIELQIPQQLQNIYDTQTGITQESLNQAWAALQQLGNTNFNLPGSIDPADFQFADPTIGDYTQQREEATQGEFGRLMGLLDPVYDQREAQLRESLASRGIPTERGQGIGQTTLSNAARGELDIQGDQRRQATENAALQAISQGREETRLGLARDQALFGQLNQQNQANIGLQQTALQQEMARQAFLQNLVASPLGYQQVGTPTLQNFYAPSNVDAVGAFAAYDQNAQSAYDTQMGMLSSIYGGLGQLGGVALGRGG
ncbi:MAG: hypothetical protein OEQ74_05205 [Gammaproteobacteria bacterium]|nr:hypothetical protein [Gammaproteobacteria bacterium]